MTRTPFVAEWVQVGTGLFQWGKKAAYWKAAKGWWASRQGHDGIKGPFRTPGGAQTWAEEPFREQHRLAQEKLRNEARQALEARSQKRAAKQARETAQTEAHEAKELLTWNGLPLAERKVQVGQVWAMKDPRFEQHQILVVEVKKTIAVVQVRNSKATPWKGQPQEPRTLGHLPKVYRLVGSAKVPAQPKH